MAKLFSEFSLHPTTLEVLAELGFESCTPVQAATLPFFLGNTDVVVEACTGSGKSLAYIIPVIEKLLRAPRTWLPAEVGGVIIAPTRELARQIGAIVEKFCVKASLNSVLLVGGTNVAEDVLSCNAGCNVIIATPGRLLDVLTRHGGSIVLKHLEVLVLDEADTLLDLGMSAAISAILAKLPKQRRTGLFSATQTREVKALARAGLRNPAVISVSVQHAPAAAGGVGAAALPPSSDGTAAVTQSTPTGLTNFHLLCSTPLAKLAALCHFLRLRAAAGEKVIVFVLTCASVDFYGRVFALPSVRSAAGLPPDPLTFPVLPLHGKMAPKKRTATYDAFVAAPAGTLLCTDVAARGIDVPDVRRSCCRAWCLLCAEPSFSLICLLQVDWIVQFDPPKDPAFYIHRVGRTARAGRRGSSLLLLLPREESYLPLLALKSVPIRPWGVLDEGSVSSVATSGAGGLSTTTAAVSVFEDGVRLGEAICSAMQAEALSDRDVLEKGTTAFVTFVRGYVTRSLAIPRGSGELATLTSAVMCIDTPSTFSSIFSSSMLLISLRSRHHLGLSSCPRCATVVGGSTLLTSWRVTRRSPVPGTPTGRRAARAPN